MNTSSGTRITRFRVDYNILIICPDRIKIERVLKRDKSSRENVLKILNNQWNDSEKAELADFVIENINKLDTEKKVNKLMSNIISIYEKD